MTDIVKYLKKIHSLHGKDIPETRVTNAIGVIHIHIYTKERTGTVVLVKIGRLKEMFCRTTELKEKKTDCTFSSAKQREQETDESS